MEKCKFCEAELEEGVTLCPSCGKDNREQPAESVEEAVAEVPAEETAVEEAPVAEAAAEETTAEEAPTEIKEGAKATPGKIALAVIAIVVLIALIVGLLAGGMAGKQSTESVPVDTVEESVETEPTVPPTTPADTGENDPTCKGTYTVSDEEAIAGAKTVVATIGDKELTNAQLQVYYWNYVQTFLSSESGYQAMMYGMLNLSQGLDTQLSMADMSLTWQQYFLKRAISDWHIMQAMALEAEAAGYSIVDSDQQALDMIPDQMQQVVDQHDLKNMEEYLALNWGSGVTMEDFVNFQKIFYQFYPYYNDVLSEMIFTAEEIEAFFNENEEAYAQSGLTREDTKVDVRHVLIMPEGATTETIRYETFPEEAWEAAEKKANELLANWQKGDKTEESFAQMANEHTADGNDSNGDGEKDGGLYTGVTKGQMVAPFEEWCFDASRKTGDVGIVKTEYGYHIMYFVNSEIIWPYYAEQDLLAVKENEFLTGVIEKHPMEVDYSAIQLAAIPML